MSRLPVPPGIIDAALYVLSAQTLTATTNGPTYDWAQGTPLPTFPFAPGGAGVPANIVIPIVSLKTSVGNEAYTFQVQSSPDGVNWTSASRAAVLGSGATDILEGPPSSGPSPTGIAPNLGVVVLSFSQLVQYLRLVITIAGTSPTITLGNCYLSPQVNPLGGQ
jgi:hypothetical protein